jgi:methyl-accepting chemotaxis protein
MGKILADMKIKWKLALLVAVPLIGFLAYAVFMYLLMNKVRVNGSVYTEIVMNKDLVADILPPPEYILETYLTALQIQDEKDPATLSALIDKCASLKKDFDDRHAVWAKNLPEGEMKRQMIQVSYEPALEFYSLLETQFIPAIKSGNKSLADELIQGKMKNAYAQHRNAIDKVVELSTKESTDLEKSTQRTINIANNLSILLSVALIALMLFLGLFIAGIISRALSRLLERMKDIATGEGDLRKRIENISKDEIGQIAKWFNTFLDKLQSIIKNISSNTYTLSSSSQALSAVSTQLAANAEEMTNQSNTVASATEQATANINNISVASEEMSSGVNTVATAIEEMSSSLNEVAKNCQKETQIVSTANSQVQSTRDMMERLGVHRPRKLEK